MADQLLDGPGVERLVVRLEGDQVVRRQLLEAVGQAVGERPGSASHDDHVEELLLDRQVALDLDHERADGRGTIAGTARGPSPRRSGCQPDAGRSAGIRSARVRQDSLTYEDRPTGPESDPIRPRQPRPPDRLS